MAIKGKKRGTTLIELVIYFALSVAALGILAALFRVMRSTTDQTYAQYLVAGNLPTTMRMIRKELQATSLASVTVYGQDAGQSPGFSCVSAYDGDGEFQLGAYGTPHWQKHVYYLLNADGNVVRSTQDIADKNYLPVLAPSPTGGSEAGKSLMHDALPPMKAVGQWQAATSFGGLEVGFVRRKGAVETISRENPRDSTAPDESTRLMEVIVRTLEENGPNFMEIKFRVAPRY